MLRLESTARPTIRGLLETTATVRFGPRGTAFTRVPEEFVQRPLRD